MFTWHHIGIAQRNVFFRRGLRLKYRADIDGLRAVAVVLVVLYHAFPNVLPGGFIGVDLFFVISGYLISKIISADLSTGNFSVLSFYRRRMQRLFPALFTMLIAVFGVGWVVLYSSELEQLSKHLVASALFVANFVFWDEINYFDNLAETKPLLHLWSLGVEEQFYFVWPALLFLSKGRYHWIFAFTALSFGLNIAYTSYDPSSAFFMPHTRFWELSTGAAIALLPKLSRLIDRQASLSAVVALACLVAAVCFTERSSFPGVWALLPVLSASLIIGCSNSWLSQALSTRPLVAIGRISYPLYLWHWPLLSFAFVLEAGVPSTTLRATCVVTALLLSLVTYHLIEKPFRRPASSRPSSALLLAPLTLITAIGSATIYMDGFPHRLARQEVLSSSAGAWDFPGELRANSIGQYDVYETDPSASDAVLFIGDSTVSQYGPRASEVARKYPGYSSVFFTRHGCLAVPEASIKSAPQCGSYMDEAIDLALSSSRIRTVVLGSQWYGGITTDAQWFINGPVGPIPLSTNGEGYEIAIDSLELYMSRVRSSGRSVIFLLSTPFGDALDPRNLVSRRIVDLPQFLNANTAKVANISSDEFQARHAALRSDLVAMANRAGARVIEPVFFLCTDEVCPAVSQDNQPIYMDRSHLHPRFVRENLTYLDCVFAPSICSRDGVIRPAASRSSSGE